MALASLSASAQPNPPSLDPIATIAHYVQDIWRTADGLPHNAVKALLQTSDGYIWLGTNAGVVRFDGVDFVGFGRLAYPTLSSDTVLSMIEGPDGALWVGFLDGGVRRLRDGLWQGWGVEDGLPHPTANVLLKASDGTVWVGTAEGITTIVDGRVVPSPHPELATTEEVLYLAEDEQGRIWAATGPRLLRIDRNNVLAFSTREGMIRGKVASVLPNPDGTLWIGLSDGRIAVIRGDRVVDIFRLPPPLAAMSPSSMFRDRSGTVWIGTASHGQGLVRLVDAAFAAYTEAEGFVDDRILSFLEGVEKSLGWHIWGIDASQESASDYVQHRRRTGRRRSAIDLRDG